METPRMTEAVQTISFDEVIPGACIRFTIINDVQYLSIRDFIMCTCNKNQNDACEVWRNLSDDKKNEVKEFVLDFKFPGRGQTPQPVITFPGAIKMAMFLPGENAKKNRSLMTNILIRYFAGDPTLICEIETNAVSDDPVANMARAALPAAADDCVEPKLKRKREELEFIKSGFEFYSTISTNKTLDGRGLDVFKDAVLALHMKDLLEIEDIRLQQTKEKLLMECEIENRKRITDNVNSKEAYEIEHSHAKKMLELEKQKQAEAREHANQMMIAEQENLKAKLGLENDRRAAEQDHAKMLLDMADQKQPTEGRKVKEQWQYASKDFPEIHSGDITSGKDYVYSLLHGQMNYDMIRHTYSSLIYRLKRYHPTIQVIKRDNRIFFKHADLPAIQRILYKTIGM
jgi:hypothetical protein